ncbi:Hypothetical predicted protein [Paramuricea clavata]|uniref:Uncharacterized protein n=1 Tax=Paramuricea clavata TaxID=317549 RepID=A0A6S7GCF6_PARCT|nr:Hypothetical predicted protein [Paramuricea clavata]
MAELPSKDEKAVQDTPASIVLQAALKGGSYSFVVSAFSAAVVKDVCGAAVRITKELGGANVVEMTKEICGTVFKLGALYTSYKLLQPVIEAAVKKGFGGKRKDQKVEEIKPRCLHVVLRCFTDERFLEVWADYESGRIKERLQKEFSEVGIEVEGLKVEIENMEEVEQTKADIHKRATFETAESFSKDKKPAQDTRTAFKGGTFSFNVTTDNVLVANALSTTAVEVTKGLGSIAFEVATDLAGKTAVEVTKQVCATAVKLGTLYTGYKLLRPVIEKAIENALGGERDDQVIRDIKPGSLHVLLCTFTTERFLEVLAYYESGRIKERLQKEFSEVGIEVEGMKVEIENMKEVEETRAAINKRSSEVISEGEAQKLLCHPTEVTSEVEAQKLLCHPIEMLAEDEAKKTKETYFLVTHDERKLSTGNGQDHSKEHGNWLTVGELMYSIRKPVSSYVDEIIKAFHENLSKTLLHAGKCNSPDDCIKKTTDDGLCNSCKHWFKELEASHENGNNPSWYENCNSAKWSEDHWEVAKFFMPALILSPVEDAESTDLSSLLNVLEFMKDDAFLGKTRVNVELVRKLRSRVKNVWVHAPEQEFTDDEKEKSFLTATKFLEDLERVCPNTENTQCLEVLKRLKTSRFIVQTNN